PRAARDVRRGACATLGAHPGGGRRSDGSRRVARAGRAGSIARLRSLPLWRPGRTGRTPSSWPEGSAPGQVVASPFSVHCPPAAGAILPVTSLSPFFVLFRPVDPNHPASNKEVSHGYSISSRD